MYLKGRGKFGVERIERDDDFRKELIIDGGFPWIWDRNWTLHKPYGSIWLTRIQQFLPLFFHPYLRFYFNYYYYYSRFYPIISLSSLLLSFSLWPFGSMDRTRHFRMDHHPLASPNSKAQYPNLILLFSSSSVLLLYFLNKYCIYLPIIINSFNSKS